LGEQHAQGVPLVTQDSHSTPCRTSKWSGSDDNADDNGGSDRQPTTFVSSLLSWPIANPPWQLHGLKSGRSAVRSCPWPP